jgi:hypothetical protein
VSGAAAVLRGIHDDFLQLRREHQALSSMTARECFFQSAECFVTRTQATPAQVKPTCISCRCAPRPLIFVLLFDSLRGLQQEVENCVQIIDEQRLESEVLRRRKEEVDVLLHNCEQQCQALRSTVNQLQQDRETLSAPCGMLASVSASYCSHVFDKTSSDHLKFNC